jgi:thymidylate synthase
MKQYLELLKDIQTNGTQKGDRTGTGTKSVFGRQLRFNLADGFPLLTTKKLHFKSIANELIWFLNGDTNTKWLKENGVKIWDEWADENGNLGDVYGAQWVNWNAEGINQIDKVISDLKNNPNSRRILFHAWNVSLLPDESKSPQENVADGKMALPPCHLLYQFYVADNKLSTQLYIRSSDSFLGLPYNIASVSLLNHMLAQQCDMELGEVIVSIGDSHIYNNHKEQVELQLTRTPKKLPKLKISTKPKDIYSYKFEDFELVDYIADSHIKGEVSV